MRLTRSSLISVFILNYLISGTTVVFADTLIWENKLNHSRQLQNNRQYEAAMELANEALQIAQNTYGKNVYRIARIQTQQANIYSWQLKYDQAIKKKDNSMRLNHIIKEHWQYLKKLKHPIP